MPAKTSKKKAKGAKKAVKVVAARPAKARPKAKAQTKAPQRRSKKAAAPKKAPKKPARSMPPTTSRVTETKKPIRPVFAAPWPEREPALDPAKVLRALPPMQGVTAPTKASLAKLGQRLPKRFLDFLAAVGFGRFANGFITIAHPHDLDETLADWLGGFDPTRVPFAMTALGDILYFRDLRRQAAMVGAPNADRACDVSVVLSRYKKSAVVATELARFVEDVLGTSSGLDSVLRKDLFDGALDRLGPPDPDQLYGFVPALALGGVEEPAALERMRAQEHLSILLQL
jgi:hypothetical protein